MVLWKYFTWWIIFGFPNALWGKWLNVLVMAYSFYYNNVCLYEGGKNTTIFSDNLQLALSPLQLTDPRQDLHWWVDAHRFNQPSVQSSQLVWAGGLGHVRSLLFQSSRPQEDSDRLRIPGASSQKGFPFVWLYWGICYDWIESIVVRGQRPRNYLSCSSWISAWSMPYQL